MRLPELWYFPCFLDDREETEGWQERFSNLPIFRFSEGRVEGCKNVAPNLPKRYDVLKLVLYQQCKYEND